MLQHYATTTARCTATCTCNMCSIIVENAKKNICDQIRVSEILQLNYN